MNQIIETTIYELNLLYSKIEIDAATTFATALKYSYPFGNEDLKRLELFKAEIKPFDDFKIALKDYIKKRFRKDYSYIPGIVFRKLSKKKMEQFDKIKTEYLQTKKDLTPISEKESSLILKDNDSALKSISPVVDKI